MRPISRSAMSIAGLLLAALALCPTPRASGAEAPVNILLIISDDQGWTDFGFMDHPVIQTPHLDRLARESALFPNAYVPTSLCRASLATLLTGMYGHQHRICCNDPPDGVDRAALHPFIQSAPALPRLLRQRNYVSLQTGKFWEGHFSNAGFTHGMTEKGRHGDGGLVIGRETLQPLDDFLDSRGDHPFFVWYAPMLPHEPHNPPERLLKKYESPGRPARLAAYYAMCEWFDETVGQVLQRLDDRGLRDNTVVMFTVDNGWIQETGENRSTRGWFAPKSKLSPYDGGLRFPLMIRWPGRIPPARHETLVSSIDVVPTLLDVAQVATPPQLPGVSLLPVARQTGTLERTAVFGEIFLHTATDIHRPALNLTHRWVRQGAWKLILPENEGEPELYNLRQDPQEQLNLAPAQETRVRELTARINAWWGGRNAPADDEAASSPDELHSEPIFPPGHLHSHGSCIVECPNGDLLTCWYQGSGERKADDVRVLGARKSAGQSSWSEPFLLADAAGFPDTNPCLLIDSDQKLWLVWQTIVANDWHTAICRYKQSTDYQGPGAPHWTHADDLLLKPGPEFGEAIARHADQIETSIDQFPADQHARLRDYLAERRRHGTDKYFSRMGWMTRVHPLVLGDRKLIVPLYSDGYDLSIMALSDDGGATWRASHPLVSLGGVQPSLARRRDGTLVALMRDNGPPPKRALWSESTDGGETWGPVTDSEIPNPGSGLEWIVLHSGRWMLVNNDTEQGRHRLSIWLSDDEGRSWRWKRAVEEAPPGPEANTASYPSLLQGRDGTIHLTYTWTHKGPQVPRDAEGRLLNETIRYARFTEDWVSSQP